MHRGRSHGLPARHEIADALQCRSAMTYTVFARKYRPQTFADLVGQEHVTRTLSNAITSGRVAHAFLFTGVRGVGKTTSARILAKALNCEKGPTPQPCNECDACTQITVGLDLDVLEMDGASNNSVDDVRRLQESIPFRPARNRFKIVIVDEVHMLSTGAFNAFLKTLEEPPAHVKFIFATTESHKVPVTIRSRCQRYDFRLIPQSVIGDRLRDILAREQITADEHAIAIVAREAAGSMRDALTLLDQVVAFSGNALSGEEVTRHLGIADREHLHALCEGVLQGNGKQALEVIDEVAEQGLDLLHFTRQWLDLLRDMVVLRVAGDQPKLVELPAAERTRVEALAKTVDLLEIERTFSGVSLLVDEVGRSSAPRTTLEMGAVRLATRPPLRDLAILVARLEALERGGAGGGGPRPTPPAQRSGSAPAASTTARTAHDAGPTATRSTGHELGVRPSGPESARPVAIHDARDDARHDARPTVPARPALSTGAQAFQRFIPKDLDAQPGSQAASPAQPPAAAASARPHYAVAAAQAPRPQAAPMPSPPPQSAWSAPSAGQSQPAAQPASTPSAQAAVPLPLRPSAVPLAPVPELWLRIVTHLAEKEPRWAAVHKNGVPGEISATRVEVAFLDGSFFGRQAHSPDGSGALKRSVASVVGPDTEVVIRFATELRGSTVAQIEASRVDERKEALKKKAMGHPRVIEALKVFPELSTKQDVQVDPD